VIQGFKDFIQRGNVIDLAVAVVIGTAFAAIVDAIVTALVNPIIGAFVPSGDLAGWVIPIPGLFDTAQLGIGLIISAAIKFFAIALVVYLVLIVPMNRWKDRQAARAGVIDEELPTEQELLVQIRDLLEQKQTPQV